MTKIQPCHRISKNKKERNKHQHNTDDGGQAMGEKMRHVQMSRWGKHNRWRK